MLKLALVHIHYIDEPSYLGIVLSGLLAKYLQTIENDPEHVGFRLISPLSDVVDCVSWTLEMCCDFCQQDNFENDTQSKRFCRILLTVVFLKLHLCSGILQLCFILVLLQSFFYRGIVRVIIYDYCCHIYRSNINSLYFILLF
jgi:hypothetical protein